MCDHPNREGAMTAVRHNDDGTPTIWCDPCLEPLIRALNDGGVSTSSSCCGHDGRGSDGQQTDAPGWITLTDNRVLLILPSVASAAALANATPTEPDEGK